ncbi:MAG: SURF1 family protein, partial [Chloroflexota bacterium]
MILKSMFSRRWLLTTLLIFVGTAVCIRLGIWQLDRLEQRRAFNNQVITMRAMPALDLTVENPNDLTSMEWRQVTVRGEYDFENQIALRNQYYGSEYGYHLITPLLLVDGRAVLVDRGWVPADGNAAPSDWRKYDEPGPAHVTGQIRLGQGKPAIGGVADAIPENGERLEIWNNLDLARISRQSPHPLLPVYIQPNVDPGDTDPPIPFQPQIELTEGSHFGYALQWFTFAL